MSRYRLFAGTALIATLAAGGCQAPSRSGYPSAGTSTAPAASSPPAPASSKSSSAIAAPRSAVARTAAAPKATGATDDPAVIDSGQSETPGAFALTVHMNGGDINAAVAPLSADLHSDGTAEPIDPPHDTAQQWLTAAWIEQSPYPAVGGHGASYIYGHACHHHVCSFTRLRDAQIGNTITVTTPRSALAYRICDTARSVKSGNLAVPSCGSAGVNLVLVTCEYEQGDQSTHNLVVAATLVARVGSGR